MKKISYADGKEQGAFAFAGLPIDVPGITRRKAHIACEFKADASAGTNAVSAQ